MTKKKMTFEESMERLEQIVRIMERGEAPLEDSLNLFKEGTQLVAECSKLLDEARLQVELVTQGADGMPQMEVFDHES